MPSLGLQKLYVRAKVRQLARPQTWEISSSIGAHTPDINNLRTTKRQCYEIKGTEVTDSATPEYN